MKFILLILFIPFLASAGMDIDELASISSEISKSMDRCRDKSSFRTVVHDLDENSKVISFSCKIGKTIFITETLINDGNKIASFQEMEFEEKLIYPQEYLKLLGNSEIEKYGAEEGSAGIQVLTTFARVGLPVVLSLRASRILSPDRLDWQRHFIAGAMISGVTILTVNGVMRLLPGKTTRVRKTVIASLAGLGMAILAGVGKEIYDSTGRGTPETRDAWFTAAGGAFVSLIFQIPWGNLGGRKQVPVKVPALVN